MHDPWTLAFRLRLSLWVSAYTLFEIWHVDPCKRGSDNSCGYSFPWPTVRQLAALKNLAFWEARERNFLRCQKKLWDGGVVASEVLYRSLLLQVADALRIPMTFEQAARRAAIKVHQEGGHLNPANIFCFVPGYHTNRVEDDVEACQDYWFSVIRGIARGLLRDRRPWYRHPRFHFWHWRFRFPIFGYLRYRFLKLTGKASKS